MPDGAVVVVMHLRYSARRLAYSSAILLDVGSEGFKVVAGERMSPIKRLVVLSTKDFLWRFTDKLK